MLKTYIIVLHVAYEFIHMLSKYKDLTRSVEQWLPVVGLGLGNTGGECNGEELCRGFNCTGHVLFLQLGAGSMGILFLLRSHCLSKLIHILWPSDRVTSQFVALLNAQPGKGFREALSSWLEQGKFLQSSTCLYFWQWLFLWQLCNQHCQCWDKEH